MESAMTHAAARSARLMQLADHIMWTWGWAMTAGSQTNRPKKTINGREQPGGQQVEDSCNHGCSGEQVRHARQHCPKALTGWNPFRNQCCSGGKSHEVFNPEGDEA